MASEHLAMASGRATGGSASWTLQPGTRLGRYRIGRVFRLGGLGITYRARDLQSDRDIAIKEYLPVELAARRGELDVEPRAAPQADIFRWGRDLFLAEARTLAGLPATTGTVTVSDCFEANGTAYMVLGSIPRTTLAARLAHEQRLSASDVEGLLWPLLDGLERLHGAGVLHLDIQPASIALDDQEHPALFDFGMARAAMEARMKPPAGIQAVRRSPYIALEQAADAGCGPFTDIYALASTLYHCVSGSAPPSAVDRPAKRLPAVSRKLAQGHRPHLLAAINAGLALKAEERPPSIAAWRPMFGAEERLTESVRQPPPATAPSSTVPVTSSVPDGPTAPVAADVKATTRVGAAGPRPARVSTVAPPRAIGRRHTYPKLALATALVLSTSLGIATYEGLLPSAVERHMADLLAAAGIAAETPAGDASSQRTTSASPSIGIDEEDRRRADGEAGRKAEDATTLADPPAAPPAANAGPRREVPRRQTGAEARNAVGTPKPGSGMAKDAAAAEAALQLSEPVRRQVQQALTSLGLEVQSPGGTFGPRTRAMIAAWQTKQAEPATGFMTAAQLATLLAQADQARARTAEADAAPSTRATAGGDREAAVVEAAMQLSDLDRRRVQVALTALGHDTGGVDGQIMARTRQMIAAWQKRRGEPQTGYLTPQQLVVLSLQAKPALDRFDRAVEQGQPRR